MRPRTVAILALVVGTLAAFIWFVERDLPSTEERAELAKRVLPGLDPETVDRLRLEYGDRELELERRREQASATATPERAPASSDWWLVEPIEAAADDGAVESLLEGLVELEKERTLTDMRSSDAGLEPPRGQIVLTRGGEPTVLELGAPIPASSTLLLAVRGEEAVHVAEDRLIAELERTLDEWRNRRLFPAPRSAIVGIQLERGESERVVLTRRGEELRIEEPFVDVADRESVEQLLSQLVGLEAASFLTASRQDWEALSGTADEAISVELEGGNGGFRLELGSTAEEGRYARLGDLVVTTRSNFGDFLGRSPEEWRSSALTTLRVFEVERLEVEDGEGRLELERREGAWFREEVRIPFATINDLLYAVEDARAVGFGAEASLPVSDPPRLRLRYRAGEGEEQRITLFDASPQGVPARVDGRDTTLLLSAETAHEIERSVAAVRSAEAMAD